MYILHVLYIVDVHVHVQYIHYSMYTCINYRTCTCQHVLTNTSTYTILHYMNISVLISSYTCIRTSFKWQFIQAPPTLKSSGWGLYKPQLSPILFYEILNKDNYHKMFCPQIIGATCIYIYSTAQKILAESNR